MNDLDGVFWTGPSDDDARPTDPLGLDAMREELSDRLVPCLTGRTRSHEDFFWSLVFFRWSAEEERTEEERARRFVHWESCLKVYWAHLGRDGFAGVNHARTQAMESHAPSASFRPLLKNQRAQGMSARTWPPCRSSAFWERRGCNLLSQHLILLKVRGPP